MKKITSLLVALFTLAVTAAPTYAATFDSVTHIHNVKAFGVKMLMGSHEGLFLFVAQNNMKEVGKDRFDVMGLDSDADFLYASGHPSAGSKLPNPVGLLRSKDGGKNWKSISLLGVVDFHSLEVSGDQIYGGNATLGTLMYSGNSGRSWKTMGADQYADIAILAGSPGQAIALKDGKLLKTANSFRSSTSIKFTSSVTAVESMGKSLFIAAKNQIHRSADGGLSWKVVKSYKSDISDISVSAKIVAVVVGGEVLSFPFTA